MGDPINNFDLDGQFVLSERARREAASDEAAAGVPPSTGSLDHGRVADAPVGRRAVARLVDFAVGLALFVGWW